MFPKIFAYTAAVIMAGLTAVAVNPTASRYTMSQCAGSYMPYPAPDRPILLPDSLTPVLLNHVGRHGARYFTSPVESVRLLSALDRADSLGTITGRGIELRTLIGRVLDMSHNHWGDLDSLGITEQQGIASRMFINFPTLFNNGRINAISTYVPRCVMSMYAFTHQIDRLNNHNDITTSSGRQNSELLRPFDTDEAYIEWRKNNRATKPYNEFVKQNVTQEALKRILGDGYPFDNGWRELALAEYRFVSGMSEQGIQIEISKYFTDEEYNALWSCRNLEQYLQRTSTTISAIPGQITTTLIEELIRTFDNAVNSRSETTVYLRFGHAETLLPLLCQLRLPGCHYLTNYYDTVALHWRNFDIVPMAANLQMVLSRSTTGRYYITTYLNERPIDLCPDSSDSPIPYETARTCLTNCLY